VRAELILPDELRFAIDGELSTRLSD